MATQAVHLELTEALSAQSFLQAFHHFVSQRGLSSVMMSDNAKTFKSVSKDIKIRQSKEVQQHLTSRQVDWQFILEKAPWWGGLGVACTEYKEMFEENYWPHHLNI